ncbi:MAG: hypothetical protein QFC55_06975 [Chloroflexota bacterium]|nr:hypothetical protein [Chloroflexota bacterium]
MGFIATILAVACGAMSVSPSPEASPTASFSSSIPPPITTFPPIPDVHVVVGDMSLAASKIELEMSFTGAAPYEPQDACSADYGALTWVVLGDLVVSITPTKHSEQATLRPGQICADVGFERELTVTLPEPYEGDVVRDLGGDVHLLRRPMGILEFDLPDVWSAAGEGDAPTPIAPQWCRRFVQPTSTHSIQICQSFGAPTTIEGAVAQSVEVAGTPATMWLTHSNGELILAWMFEDDGVAIIANSDDFDPDQLIAVAATAHR